jgi:hypothetical protein
MLAPGMPFSLSLPFNQCVVPQGLNGAVAIWITSDDQPLNGGVIDRQSNAIVAGPLMTFIDIDEDQISILIRNKGSKGSSGSGYSGSSSSNSGSYNPGMNSGSYNNPGMMNSGMGMPSSFASTTTVSPSDAAAIIASLPTSAPTPTGSPAPNGVVANGVSMVPLPTS